MYDPDIGNCACGGNLHKVWFVQQEWIKGVYTGRVRDAVSHLVCEECLKEYAIDDTFDSLWRNKR